MYKLLKVSNFKYIIEINNENNSFRFRYYISRDINNNNISIKEYTSMMSIPINVNEYRYLIEEISKELKVLLAIKLLSQQKNGSKDE